MTQAARATLGIWAVIVIIAVLMEMSPDNQWHLMALAGLAALGIAQTVLVYRQFERARQTEALVTRLKNIYAALSQTNQAVARAHGRDELFDAVCRIASELGQFEMAWIGLADPVSKEVKPVASAGGAVEYLTALTISIDPHSPFGNGPTGTAIRTGEVRVVNDLASAQATTPWRNRAERHGFRSSAAFPILFGGHPVGALNLYSALSGFFTPDRVDLLKEMAAAVSWGLDRLALEEQARIQDFELRQAVTRLVSFNAELQRFTVVAAHDLQEPIRSVVSFTQLLERSLGDRLAEVEREFCDMAVAEAKRMQRMILDLLVYAEASEQKAPHLPVALDACCTDAVLDLDDRIAEAGARVHVHIPGTTTVMGDPTALQLVFHNLLSNSLKFRHPDAVPEIQVFGVTEDDEAIVTVADNGIGLGDSDQDVFEIFRRLHAGPAFPGSGVGLAVCKRIVEAHGGRIWVDKAAGLGTTITFALPLGGPPVHATLGAQPSCSGTPA